MRQNGFTTMKVSLLGLLLALPLAANQTPPAETSLEEKVDAAIRGSARYGPFDLISFEVKGDAVTLGGSAYRAILKEEAAQRVEAVPGVAHVVNTIEILPVSLEDDRLRRAVFTRIYRDNFLAKYGTPLDPFSRGAVRGRSSRGVGAGALGLEPLGNYAIHVVVKRGRVTLYGFVDNDVDRLKAALDARGVFGVMGIENRIEVLPKTPTA